MNIKLPSLIKPSPCICSPSHSINSSAITLLFLENVKANLIADCNSEYSSITEIPLLPEESEGIIIIGNCNFFTFSTKLSF